MSDSLHSGYAGHPEHAVEALIASCLWAYSHLGDTSLRDAEELRRLRQRIYKARLRLNELMAEKIGART